MAKRRKVGNPLALAVLAYLARQPMHPYQLGRTLRDHDDDRSIKYNHGSLYMVVQQLAKAGFIAAQETTRSGQLPERTVYAVTDTGRAELNDWLTELVAEPQHEYPNFVAALSLIGVLPPGEVVELLGRRLRRLTTQRIEIRDLIDRTLATGVHPLFLVEEEYRLALLEAESAFVERFIDRITDPEDGWGPRWAQLAGEPAPTQVPAGGGGLTD
jgi:DNA-binding PadR family transcriptional regulator